MRKIIITCLAAGLAGASILAADTAEAKCLTAKASINVTIQGKAASMKAAKAIFDEKVKLVEDFAKKQGIKEPEINSLNYSINYNPRYDSYGEDRSGSYRLNGNVQIKMDDEEQALTLTEHLIANKMQAGMNVNSYRRNELCE